MKFLYKSLIKLTFSLYEYSTLSLSVFSKEALAIAISTFAIMMIRITVDIQKINQPKGSKLSRPAGY